MSICALGYKTQGFRVRKHDFGAKLLLPALSQIQSASLCQVKVGRLHLELFQKQITLEWNLVKIGRVMLILRISKNTLPACFLVLVTVVHRACQWELKRTHTHIHTHTQTYTYRCMLKICSKIVYSVYMNILKAHFSRPPFSHQNFQKKP